VVFNVVPVPEGGNFQRKKMRKPSRNKSDWEPMKLKLTSPCCSDCDRHILKKNMFYHLGGDDREQIPIGTVEKTEKEMCSMQFHLTQAKKMLASVAKITETGDEVKFGGGEGESYIRNVKTGRKIYLQRQGDLYPMNIMIWDGDEVKKCKAVVNSGARRM